MVERLRQAGIKSEAVLDAMLHVPREAFVPAAVRGRAYEDERLPIGLGQTISLPWTVARMTELAGAIAGSRVLEVGTGSGYHAAVLSQMGAIVFSVERHADLARRAGATLRQLGFLSVTVKHFDGTYGWAAEAPYAAILAAAAGPEVPSTLVAQLATRGSLVLPVLRDGEQRLVRVTRLETGSIEEDCGAASFVPLIGRYGFEGPRNGLL